jgi:hypothetical protein
VVVDLYLSAVWLAWRHLPRPPGVDADGVAMVVLRAANDAVAALAGGFETAQRLAIRHEEAGPATPPLPAVACGPGCARCTTGVWLSSSGSGR